MRTHHAPASTEQIEQTIVKVVRQEGTITFSSLADICTEYRWVALFKALHNLEKHRLVTLTPLPWDYQITTRQLAPKDSQP